MYHHFFSSTNLLKAFLDRHQSGNHSTPAAFSQELYRQFFLEIRATNPSLPDYYYKNWLSFVDASQKRLQNAAFFLQAFRELNQRFLHWHFELPYVRDSEFSAWQDTLLKFDPLPLLAYSLFRHANANIEHCIQRCRLLFHNESFLPSPFYPELEALIREQGLYELHNHINGTTEASNVWLHALTRPLSYYRFFCKGYEKPQAREFFHQQRMPFTPTQGLKILRGSRSLRDRIIAHLMGPQASAQRGKSADPEPDPAQVRILNPSEISADFSGENDPGYRLSDYRIHPLEWLNYTRLENRGQYEVLLWIQIFRELERDPDQSDLLFAAHLYLLCQNYFQQQLVQQQEQKGFDQFEKITLNELREEAEKSYEPRFRQLSGLYDKQDLCFYEAKFAPKKQGKDNIALLAKILSGYKTYQTGQPTKAYKPLDCPHKQRMQLRLTAHFIKAKDKSPEPWSHEAKDAPRKPPDSSNLLPIRHRRLRHDLQKRAQHLLYQRRKLKELHSYFNSADAAGNELHAPPEVFAPTFRKCRHEGIPHFSYHAGEDFRHLLSGIRAVYEAVLFLELRPGERIGHATALGILPRLWWERMAGLDWCLERGERLDDLIFAYNLILGEERGQPFLPKLEKEIREHWSIIYGKGTPYEHQLADDAWRIRGLDPMKAFTNQQLSYNYFDQQEQEEIKKAQERKEIFEIWQRYHEPDVYLASRELIRVPYAEDKQIAMLELVQERALQFLIDKQVVIEAMPSSNVRISVYKSYEEHHIWRWLGIAKEGPKLPKPLLVIGSDDPGIFANNMRSEFSHLLHVMHHHFNLSPADRIQVIQQLNANARSYHFYT